MKQKLKEELVKLSQDILSGKGLTELPDLHHRARLLYEKLTVLTFIEEKLNDVELDVTKSVVASKFEHMATAVLRENKQVPESNPHEEDIIVPGIDTIKHMVSEMPGGEELEEVLSRLIGNTEFIKSQRDVAAPKVEPAVKGATAKSLNDTLTTRELTVGLNDRLAFVKHLFDEQADAFGKVVGDLNGMDSLEQSVAYIEKQVKPKFNWEGKEAYQQRFMELIERRFS